MIPSNGILPRIPGDYISAGSKMLPHPQEGAPAEASAELEVPDLGRVRIHYQLHSHRHGKSRRWHWVAVRAESF